MSSSSVLSIATSALDAQSTALSIISTNLANTSTVGYKESSASFSTLITDPYSTWGISGGGVLTSAVQHVDLQGLIEDDESSTSLAIDGDGFFVVSDASDTDNFYYTRVGSFSADADGYLVNDNGYYLQGWPVDADGNAISGNNGSTSSLEAINLYAVSGSAEATSAVSLVANLPADADVGDTFTTSSEIYDSLGVSHTIFYNWEKTAENTWTVSFSDPVMSSDTSVDSGDSALTSGNASVTVTFDSDGNLLSTSDDPVELSITNWTTGASDSTLTFDFGTAGSSDGLRQFASDDSDPTISVDSVTQDGVEYGELESVYISEDGQIVAVFDNGESRPIYQIPLATFNNPNGLLSLSGNVYSATVDSGDYTLNVPGYGGSGSIEGYALEASTVSTSEELTEMIVAQQAYSSAAQCISTDQQMFEALLSAVR